MKITLRELKKLIKEEISNLKESKTNVVDARISDAYNHSEKKCSYGHQSAAKIIADMLYNEKHFDDEDDGDGDGDGDLETQISAIGNEFNLKHYVEAYLDKNCKFHIK